MTLNLKSIMKASPFKIGCLVVILSGLLYYSFGGEKPALLVRLDNQLTDVMFHWRGKQPSTGSVVIVDLDEKSLQEAGQWPWPRDQVAALIKNIAAAGPRAIGLDIVFPENDRTSPKQALAKLESLLSSKFSPAELATLKENPSLDHDRILGDTVAETPTVLGYVFQTTDDGLKNGMDTPFPSINIAIDPPGIGFEHLAFRPAYRAIVNVPDIAAAQTEGFFNVFPDPSGTVRRVPLFLVFNGSPYPCLALEMVRIGQDIDKVTIQASKVSLGKKFGIYGVKIADRFIPTDNMGQVVINYRGPFKTFPYYSAIDILAGQHQNKLKDKYVLIGTSAAGLSDLRTTPFSRVFPGVEVHANLIDNILQNDPLRHDILTERALTFLSIIVGGILLSGLLAYSSPLIGGFGGLASILFVLCYGTYYTLFLNNTIVGITYPMISIFAVFLVVTLFNFFFKDSEKRFIQKAFGHYVSPQVVKELIKSPDKLSLTGEQREVTVFFNDIRGFTTISEAMDSHELGIFMNEYHTAMSNVIMKHQGTVDKYIGDAIMALWGAPLEDKAHAIKALRASLEMVKGLNQLQPGWTKRGLPPIDIGIGLNSGMVNVGNFGSDQRFDYTVIGDNVNLASRLEGQNKTYGTHILISEYTWKEVREKFFCRFIDLVRVKGKEMPVAIYEPLQEGEPDAELAAEVHEYNRAIELYRSREFSDAQTILEHLQKDTPTRLYQIYLSRIAGFLQNPPGKDWDGVFTATSK